MADRLSDHEYTDRLLGDALRLITAGVDPELGSETVADALAALSKQAKALRAMDYALLKERTVRCPACDAAVVVSAPAPESLAKTMAQTAKMIDETARLVQFVRGKPDSRPEVSGLPVDVLKALTDAQLQQVMGWVEERARGEATADLPERDGAA